MITGTFQVPGRAHLSNERNLVGWVIKGIILPSYIGIIINHFRYPYKPTRIQWKVGGFFSWLTCYCLVSLRSLPLSSWLSRSKVMDGWACRRHATQWLAPKMATWNCQKMGRAVGKIVEKNKNISWKNCRYRSRFFIEDNDHFQVFHVNLLQANLVVRNKSDHCELDPFLSVPFFIAHIKIWVAPELQAVLSLGPLLIGWPLQENQPKIIDYTDYTPEIWGRRFTPPKNHPIIYSIQNIILNKTATLHHFGFQPLIFSGVYHISRCRHRHLKGIHWNYLPARMPVTTRIMKHF